MISDRYQALQERLHQRKRWGAGGYRHIPEVRELIAEFECASVLDFGAGQGTLGNNITGRDKRGEQLPVKWTDYDPGFPHLRELPADADLVVSTHVLEHVEPDLLSDTLDQIFDIANKVVFIAVPSEPANEWLADGRNAHLTCEPPEWWQKKLERYGHVRRLPDVIFKNGRRRDETRFVISREQISENRNKTKSASGKRKARTRSVS